MNRTRSQGGFSLVELMVTIGIIAILGMLAIPSFRGVMPRVRLNNDTMLLANELAMARVRAISKSKISWVILEPAAESYQLRMGDPVDAELGRTVLAGTKIYKTGTFTPTYHANGTFIPPSWTDPPAALVPADTLRFTENGQVSNVPLDQQAVIELRTEDGERRKRLFVEPTGRVHVWRWGGTWTED